MCFIEYIGYACGHSTIHVQRPCPLTTHLRTNPVCPKPAERPTQVNTNCPTCARILHTRWVEIVTLEHQWMHERGVCGCSVVFPALQQPRVVGKMGLVGIRDGEYSSNSDDSYYLSREKADECGSESYTQAERTAPAPALDYQTGQQHPPHPHPHLHSSQDVSGRSHCTGQKKNKCKRKSKKTGTESPSRSNTKEVQGNPNRSKPHALAWDSTIPPLVEIDEHSLSSSLNAIPTSSVSVRLSSQYGAEWIPEHGALHASGTCNCPVAFNTYKPYALNSRDITNYAPDWEIKAPIKALTKPTLRSSDIMVWKINAQNPNSSPIDWPIKMEDFGFNTVAEAEAWLAAEDSQNSRVLYGDAMDNHMNAVQSAPMASTVLHSGIRAKSQADTFNEWDFYEDPLFACRYAAAQEFPTQTPFHNSVDQLHKSTTQNPIIATPVSPTYHQQKGLPLVGWPLGAGPEGGMENSHSPAWNMCRLSRPRLERSQSCPRLGSKS